MNEVADNVETARPMAVAPTGRSGFIDFSRGILAFLVLWGHAIQNLSAGRLVFFDDWVFKTIYSFHMPLFMLLSGYVFFWSCKRGDLKQVIFKRLKGLVPPMFTWAIFEFFRRLRVEGGAEPLKLMRRFASCFFNTEWFLWSVLLSSVIIALIYYSGKSTHEKCLMLLLAVVIIAVLPVRELTLFVFPYFVIGFVMNQCGLLERKKRQKLIIAVSIAVWIGTIFLYQVKHSVYVTGTLPFHSTYGFWGQIRIDLFRYASGWFGCIAVLAILQFIYQRILRLSFTRYIEIFGKHSLPLHVMQGFFLSRLSSETVEGCLNALGLSELASHILVLDFVVSVAYALLLGAVVMVVYCGISKSKVLSFALFGK